MGSSFAPSRAFIDLTLVLLEGVRRDPQGFGAETGERIGHELYDNDMCVCIFITCVYVYVTMCMYAHVYTHVNVYVYEFNSRLKFHGISFLYSG